MFDLDKVMKEHGGKCRNKRGESVRIICTDAKGGYSVVGLTDFGDHECEGIYTKSGCRYGGESDLRLVNPPEVIERWVIVKKNGLCSCGYESLAKAGSEFDPERHAGILPYRIEDGKLVLAEVVEP